jgi:hypothetical protein
MLRNKKFLLCVAMVLCLFHVFALLGHSMREGRLSLVPVYDDVSYLVDGIGRVDALQRGGVSALLKDMWVQAPHAPLMALTAAFGFLLSAGATWGPYLVNGLWVLVIIQIMMVALRVIDRRSQVGIAAAALAAPMFGWMVSEFRPDPVWGMLVGVTVTLLASVDFAMTSTRRWFALGILVGVAVISKPTAAPATLVVITTAWLAMALASVVLLKSISKRLLLRNALSCLAGAALIAVPYFAASAGEIYAYIKMVMGANGEVWRLKTDAKGHLTYYLSGGLGPMMLGWIWYASVPTLAISLIVIVRARDRRSLCAFLALAGAFAAAYGIVTLSAVKQPMIGSILYGTVVAFTVWGLGQIVRLVPIRHELILLAGALVFLAQWTPNVGMIRKSEPSMQIVDESSRAVAPVVINALRTHTNKRVFMTVPGPVQAATLDYLARQQGVVGTFVEGYLLNNWDEIAMHLGRGDIAVLCEVGMSGQSSVYSFPSLEFQTKAIEYMRANASFDAYSAYKDSEGRIVWVFVRKVASNPQK